MFKRIALIISILAALVLAACDSNPTPIPTPTELPCIVCTPLIPTRTPTFIVATEVPTIPLPVPSVISTIPVPIPTR